MFEADLGRVEEQLRDLCSGLDPASCTGSQAHDALERFGRIANMAQTGARLMGARVADTGFWKNQGKSSPAQAVADALGLSHGDAHRQLGTARKQATLPELDRQSRTGELSATQAGHVADAAAVDPTAEKDLLELAEVGSVAELQRESRQRRHAATGDDGARRRRIHKHRSARLFTDDDGAARLSWTHLPELGAELAAVLEPYIDDRFNDARRGLLRERREAYAADAIVDVFRDAAAFRRGEHLDDDEPVADQPAAEAGDATEPDVVASVDGDDRIDDGADVIDEDDEAARATGNGTTADTEGATSAADASTPSSAGNDTTDDPPPAAAAEREPRGLAPPKRRKKRVRRRRGADAKVIVRIDHQALLRGHTQAGEICEIAGLGPVPVASVRELMDDAFIAAVILKGHDVVNVAHLGRAANAHQRTAIQAGGQACTTLGCPNTAFLIDDHRDPWVDVRITELSNLDSTCPCCNYKKTHLGHRHTNGTGRRPLLSPTEQAEWNRTHPDDPIAPIDPPGRRGPWANGRPDPDPTIATSTVETPDQPASPSQARPLADQATLDL